MRRALELDGDRRLAPSQALSRAHVERHVCPAPVVDVELGGDVRLGHRVAGDALLLSIAAHLDALDEPAPVLAADDALRPGRVQRAQHLHLLVPDGVGGEVDRRLHRRQGDELEQVVLEDVADRARLLVEGSAALDADRLRHGDLDVVYELAVPDRLEDPVRKAKGEHVLDRLLAEVVVDAKDLVLAEVLREPVVQLARGGEVVAEGLLDHEAHPALLRAVLGDLVDQRRDRARGNGEVVDVVAGGAALLVE